MRAHAGSVSFQERWSTRTARTVSCGISPLVQARSGTMRIYRVRSATPARAIVAGPDHQRPRHGSRSLVQRQVGMPDLPGSSTIRRLEHILRRAGNKDFSWPREFFPPRENFLLVKICPQLGLIPSWKYSQFKRNQDGIATERNAKSVGIGHDRPGYRDRVPGQAMYRRSLLHKSAMHHSLL